METTDRATIARGGDEQPAGEFICDGFGPCALRRDAGSRHLQSSASGRDRVDWAQ
jgi:hypothetical protein